MVEVILWVKLTFLFVGCVYWLCYFAETADSIFDKLFTFG